ncbi:MAG: Rieske 2Fe-2S domain-containing protein [Polyangiaceae bacterium]
MALLSFNGYPTGWFVVAWAEDLGPGDVKPMRYFGRDLVAYRGLDDGLVHIHDAFCPHLGAHLAYGGKVEGNDIRCPFHAWKFGADGNCNEVPYAKRIPPKACVRTFPILETNGLIYLWHDSKRREPFFEVPKLEGWGDPEWTGWTKNILTIKTHPKEIVENVADKGHFPRVHGTHVDTFDNEFNGHLAIQRTSGIAYPRGGGKDKFSLEATYYGPGFQVTDMQGYLHSRLVNAHTPIDQHSLHLRFGVMLKKIGDDAKMEQFAQGYINNLQVGFQEDIAIWENKLYRDRPMLCDGDGAIGALRKWYAQFYDQEAPASLPVAP